MKMLYIYLSHGVVTAPYHCTFVLIPSIIKLAAKMRPSSSSHSSQTFPLHYHLPGSWNQLLNAVEEEEERYRSLVSEAVTFYPKLENWEIPVIPIQHGNNYYVKEMETLAVTADGGGSSSSNRSPWNQHLMMLPAVVPSSMLDFANEINAQKNHHHPRPEGLVLKCDSTEIAAGFSNLKKPRMNQATNFKVRKEKVGDRITILHQLVSPFGKTDTASVLLEAIGYIRFLHAQVQVLSSPYLDSEEAKIAGSGEVDSKDLRSRGLCVVPISCTMHVGSDNGG